MRRLESRSRCFACMGWWQASTEHLEHMLSRNDGIEYSGEACSNTGEGRFRLRNEVSRFRTRPLKFALKISQCYIDIANGHFWVGMAQ